MSVTIEGVNLKIVVNAESRGIYLVVTWILSVEKQKTIVHNLAISDTL